MAVSGAPDRFLRADGKALAKEAPPAPGAPKLKVDTGFGGGRFSVWVFKCFQFRLVFREEGGGGGIV